MRARLVEDMNFERGQDPKQVMELGGFDLQKAYQETYKKGYDEYKDFMNQFIGKKVSFVVSHDAENNNYKKVNGKRITIQVHSYMMHGQDPNTVWFFGDSHQQEKYMIEPGEKIYIEE